MHRFVSCVGLLAGCYHPANETACMVACATDGTCPTGLMCGSDQLCHSGTADCTELVSGTSGHTLITNDGSGSPIQSSVTLAEDQLALSALLSDTGAMPPVTFSGDTFSFVRNATDEAYRLDVRPVEETAISTEIQDDVPALTVWSPYFGRQIRSGVSRQTMLNFVLDGSGTLPSRSYVSSTGLRTFTTVSSVSVSGSAMTFSVDWMSASSLYGGVGLLTASDGDVLWYTGFNETVLSTTNTYQNYWSISDTVRSAVTLANGVTQNIDDTLSPAPADRCVDLMVPRLTEVTRVAASTPFGSDPSSANVTNWGLFATPFADVTPTAGIWIVMPASNSPIFDQTLPITYANPYPEDQVAWLNAYFHRTSTFQGGSATLNWGTNLYSPVPTASPSSCAQLALSATIAMPGVPNLGGTPLRNDGQMVSIDSSAPVTLDFTPSGSGAADDWTVLLYQVTVTGPSLSLIPLQWYWTRTTNVSIDPHVFVSGQAYIFYIGARVGFPQASSGNYQPIIYPYGSSQGYSAVFQVQ